MIRLGLRWPRHSVLMRDFREEGPDEAKEGRYITEINTQPGTCIRDCPSWIVWPDPSSSAKTNEVLEYYPLLIFLSSFPPSARPNGIPRKWFKQGTLGSWVWLVLSKTNRPYVLGRYIVLQFKLSLVQTPGAGTQIPRVCSESPFPVWVQV
jgi:hypothetical protein